MTEATEGFLDSDEEDALHSEIDSITSHQVDLEANNEDYCEKRAARLFNQLALHIVDMEKSYLLLHNICITSIVHNTESDPKLSMVGCIRSTYTYVLIYILSNFITTR